MISLCKDLLKVKLKREEDKMVATMRHRLGYTYDENGQEYARQSFGDYLKLLKASWVVLTMSKFKEGWCRTAHEAMLLKTPVIGSGTGGMRELLENGKQIVCPEFDNLREKVKYLFVLLNFQFNFYFLSDLMYPFVKSIHFM